MLRQHNHYNFDAIYNLSQELLNIESWIDNIKYRLLT